MSEFMECARAVVRDKFIVLNAIVEKNNFDLKKLEKEEIDPRVTVPIYLLCLPSNLFGTLP